MNVGNVPGLQTYQYVTKKYMFDLLRERYQDNEPIISRLSHYLATEQDVRDFVKVAMDAYELGYLKAVNDYKSQLDRIGYNVQVVSPKG